MSKMIQIRNVPEQVHRRLKALAAMQGMSLSDYLLRYVTRLAETPTLEEITERIKARSPVTLSEAPEDIIRAERDSR